jgi:ubiquinone/menaquinone biosynthesis C-methylase UbiE
MAAIQPMAEADFDHIANQYDDDFSFTLIGKAQRNLVWDVLDRYYQSFDGVSILEVNCGTGVDALKFAKGGAHLLATDISPEMVNVTHKKIGEYPKASTRVLDLNQIEEVEEDIDLIFSNFGGLNCLNEQELRHFIIEGSKKLKSNGLFVLVIMPRNTVWESLYFSAKFSFGKAFRRMNKQGVQANVDGKNVHTYYYNPRFFDHFQQLETISVTPIGLHIPPSYLENRFKQKQVTIDRYYKKDKKKFDRQWLAKFADHYCIVLRKK